MNITILTVDTDRTRTLLNSKLEEQNHKVIAESNNYEEALELYNTYLPDIIISDIDLGKAADGVSFLTELLEIDPNAQIIALSTFFEDTTKGKLLRKGINRLIMKPYQPAHIWEQIDNICETNNIAELRIARENLISNNTLTKTTKGQKLNNQILSLRNQISKSRSIQDDKAASISLDIEVEESYITKDSNFSSNRNSMSDDFSLDFEYEDSQSSLVLGINKDQTYISDNLESLNVSLYDTFEKKDSSTASYKDKEYVTSQDEFQVNEDFHKTYLGLPVFIDRENNYSSSDDTTGTNYNTQKSTTVREQSSLLKKLLKRKGGK